MSSLAIQIVHYRTPDLLEGCLRAIFAQRIPIHFSVRVMNNGPAADITAIAERWQNKVYFTQNPQGNVGFGCGHNQLLFEDGGWEAADFTLLLNASVTLPADAIERLIRFMENTPLCGAVGPQLLSPLGKHTIDHGELHGWRSWIARPISYRLCKHHNQPAEVAWVCGAAMLIRTELMQRLNGFDTEFFLFREEEDLLERLRKNLGWRVWYNPLVTGTHIVHASGATFRQYMGASHLIFARKHCSRFNPFPKLWWRLMVGLRLWQ